MACGSPDVGGSPRWRLAGGRDLTLVCAFAVRARPFLGQDWRAGSEKLFGSQIRADLPRNSPRKRHAHRIPCRLQSVAKQTMRQQPGDAPAADENSFDTPEIE